MIAEHQKKKNGTGIRRLTVTQASMKTPSYQKGVKNREENNNDLGMIKKNVWIRIQATSQGKCTRDN